LSLTNNKELNKII